MPEFVLTIYWWEGDVRSTGGEYTFSATDDAGAISYVRGSLDEQIGSADQAVLKDDCGRLIWENKWPVEQGVDRLPPG